MSHDTSFATDVGGHEDVFPPGRVGISRGVLAFVLVAILTSVTQGAFVSLFSSAWAHAWPSISSTKVDLPPSHLP